MFLGYYCFVMGALLSFDLNGDGHYDKNHRILSSVNGRGVWFNVNTRQIIYENQADKDKAERTVQRYPGEVTGCHHNPNFASK